MGTTKEEFSAYRRVEWATMTREETIAEVARILNVSIEEIEPIAKLFDEKRDAEGLEAIRQLVRDP